MFAMGIQIALQAATQEARHTRHSLVGPVQVFCGVTKLLDIYHQLDLSGVGTSEREVLESDLDRVRQIFAEFELDPTRLRRALRREAPGASQALTSPQLAPRLGELLEGEAYTGSGALPMLLSDLVLSAPVAAELINAGAAPAELARRLQERPGPAENLPKRGGRDESAKPLTPCLDKYCRDLTALAHARKLAPVIGRDTETLQLVQTLARQNKSNAILVGPAGVGKTAIVEGLAQQFAQGKYTTELGSMRLLELDMTRVLAGATYAGQREERLEAIIKECSDNTEIVLFIDEIHTLMKAGGIGGAIDPADILKPALARSDIRCIGATTDEEYRRYIESDAALQRRFSRVWVQEPSQEATMAILQGVRSRLENHHGVTLPDPILEDALRWSVRFDTRHHLPDKALDILDKAAAATRLPSLSMVGLQEQETRAVSRHTLARILGEKVGIPGSLILRAGQPFNAETCIDAIKKQVAGQDEALEKIVDRLALSFGELSVASGPLATMLFLGPSGVGKTEVCKQLNEFLFGHKRSLLRLDMSEFMEPHSAAKLIGSPPGYIGFDEGGQLSDRLRDNPHCVVLLDEIEKAHPAVFDIFLQVFDEGVLTDAHGRTIDARHAIFVMTSNITPQTARAPAGFSDSDADQLTDPLIALRQAGFRTEFVNRIDAIVTFAALTPAVVHTLVARELTSLGERLTETQAMQLCFDEEVVSWLAERAYHPLYGARELHRVMQTYVELPITRVIGHAAQATRLDLKVDREQLEIKVNLSKEKINADS